MPTKKNKNKKAYVGLAFQNGQLTMRDDDSDSSDAPPVPIRNTGRKRRPPPPPPQSSGDEEDIVDQANEGEDERDNTASSFLSTDNITATDNIRYIKFGAKSLNKAQRNYGATRRELLAVVTAIQDCRDYVYGRKFELFTDHKSLTFLMTQTKLNYMQLNAIDVLFDCNFNINHRPGIEMVLPDGLSRMFREYRSTKGECGTSVSKH